MDLKQAMDLIGQALEKGNAAGAFSLLKETPTIVSAYAVVNNYLSSTDYGKSKPVEDDVKTKKIK